MPKEPKLDPLVIAFLQGAKWWECGTTNATMWQSDQKRAVEEAKKRLARGTLGKQQTP